MAHDFLSGFQSALDEVTAIFTDGSPTPSFNYKGVDYPAIINDVELSNELKEGGLLESLATVIVVSKSVLDFEPASGETLYIGTKKARIEQVKTDEVSYEIHCRTATR
jgi:hypothetical protein